MGWNTVEKVADLPLLNGVESGDFFYFVHSYYVVPDESKRISTLTQHGISFASSVCKENLFATQFHPEKSQEKGLRILKNFAKAVE